MRGRSILILLVLILPTLQPGPSSIGPDGMASSTSIQSVAQLPEGLLISEVCPGRPVEYVIITNHGPERSVKGLRITDGEGDLMVNAELSLRTGCSLALVTNATIFSSLHPGIECLEKGSPVLSWSGRFALADGGDAVELMEVGITTDVLVYGEVQYNGDGWSGPSIGTIPKAHAAVRKGADLDNREGWSIEPPGRSSFPSEMYQAVVEPFSVPENAAERLVREIDLAARTVNCSVYDLTDPAVVTALARCSRRGVEVNVLLEGQPVGGLSEASKAAIATLQASQVEVRLLRSADSYKRYDYLHAKYLVADGRRTVVMSENWGVGLDSNRGWGVCLDGVGIAAFYDGVFRSDFEGRLDIVTPDYIAPTLEPVLTPTTDLCDLVRFKCPVRPVVSPELSGSVLHSLIVGAQNRILVEQMSVDEKWLTSPSLASDLISAAARGVQVRVLLDSSWGGEENSKVAERLNAIATANALDLEARVISEHHGLSVMHNKGLIVDDQAVISSINWGDSSLNENREVGVVVQGQEVADFFAHLFWSDWSVDPFPPTAVLPWTYLTLDQGEVAFLDGTMSRDNSRALVFEWDLEGDGTIDNRSPAWAVHLAPGNHTVVLTVRDIGNNTATASCWVMIRPLSSEAAGPFPYLLALPIIATAVAAVLKRIIGRKVH